MKNEKNHVYVNNPDGASPPIVNDGKEKYPNDSPGAIRETLEQEEQYRVAETFDDPKNDETLSPDRDGADRFSSESLEEAASQGAASIASSTAGFGALAGVVAATVAAAVIVIAAFVFTLKVNLSLLLSDVDRLVFEVEMNGGQEEDFEKPIFAVLTSSDGTYLEQEIIPGVRYLTFDGLEPGREYLIRIKNEEKVFVKKSFCTAVVRNDRGSIETFMEGGKICVRVMEARLEAGERYTLVAKDAAGNVLFVRDGVEPDAEYRFEAAEAQNVYFSLSIGGKAVALSEIEVQNTQEASDPTPEWSWAEDHLSAILILSGTEVEATVTSEWIEEQSCENDGVELYTATAVYGGKTYTDSRTVTYLAGHDYGDLIAEVPADCEHTGTAAHYECSVCSKLFVFETDGYVGVEESDLILPALDEVSVINREALLSETTEYGQIYAGRSVMLMTADGSAAVLIGAPDNTSHDVSQYSVFTVLYVNPYPSIVLTYSDGENTYYLNTTELGDIVKYDLPEREGSYDQIKFTTPYTSRLYVSKDLVDYYFVYDVASESIVLTADVSEVSEDNYVYMYVLPSHTYGELIPSTATCEEGGVAAHYYCSVCHKYFDENKIETTPEALAVPETGHAYGDLVAEVPADCVTDGTAAHYHCSVCDKYFDANKAETTADALVIAAPGHTYGDLVTEVAATCDTDGMAAHYHCSACGAYFDADQNETTLEALTIPAIGPMGEPTMLTSENTSADMVGKKVYLMTGDHSVGVALGQTNNMSTDPSLFTEFTITAVSGSAMSDLKVTIVSPDGKYLTKSYGTIAFTNPNAQTIIVGLTGGLDAGNDLNPYLIIYDEGVIKLADVYSFDSENLHMFLLGAPGHDYGTLIPSTATCESGGTAAHYECSICHKIFDENKVETTLQALAVSATEHTYGELIPENDNGNGLVAHYECSVCHKLFDGDHVEKTAAELAIGDGTGLYVQRITTDMLPTSDDPPTADLFDGFEAVDWEEIKDWTSLKSGTFYVIYGFDESGFYYCNFENGVVTDSEATLTTASCSSIRDLFINTYGYTFYYTIGS